MLLQELISVINNHILHPRRTRNNHRLIEPRVPLIARLRSNMKSHAIICRIPFLLPEALEYFSLPRPRPGSLEVDHNAVVSLQIVPRVQMCRLLIGVVVAHDLPVCISHN